jgi:hypothetical protein
MPFVLGALGQKPFPIQEPQMRRHRVFQRSAGLSLALLGTLLVSAPAQGAEPAATKPVATVSGEAVRMHRDAQTGELRAPTEQEMAARRVAPGQAKRAPLAVKSHGGGMVSAVLGDRALEELVARKDANGKLVIEHSAPGATPRAAAAQREEK